MENKSDVIASLWPIGVAVGQGQRGLLALNAALYRFLSFFFFCYFLSSSLTLKNPVSTLRQTGVFILILLFVFYIADRGVTFWDM